MTNEQKKARRKELKSKFAEFLKSYSFDPTSLPGEIWRDVEGYDGFYQISNFGRVKSFYRGKISILKPSIVLNGYMKHGLSKNGSTKNFSIHVLVAKAFIPNPENKPQVNHKDGNKWNNHVENLEWMTDIENKRHAYQTGLKKNAQGEDCYISKLTNAQAKWCREVYKWRDREFGAAALARKFGVNPVAMQKIIAGKTYKNVE